MVSARERKEKERRKSMCDVKEPPKKGRKESCLISDGRSEAMLREVATEPRGGARKKEERIRGRLHSLVIESRGWRREKKEQSRLHLLLHPAFVPLPRHTYFQSPGKSVDSSLFPLLGLLAGYPFQQTWWLKRVVTITDSSTYSFTKTRSVWLISDQELDIKWCCLTAAPLKTNQAF